MSCERRVPATHPPRAILPLVDGVLAGLSPEFERLYALNGRPSVPPEKVLRALYSVRSERQLMEQLNDKLLFRWLLGLGVDEPVRDVTAITMNRDRLLDGAIAARFFAGVLARPELAALLSDEHFSVDGTLIQAPAAAHRRHRAATAGAISRASGARTRPTPRPAMRTRACSARAPARPAGSASSACADGEPQRAGGRRGADPGRRDGRELHVRAMARGGKEPSQGTPRGPGHARRPARPASRRP